MSVLLIVATAMIGEVPRSVDSKITLITRETSLVKFEKGQPLRADAIVSPDNQRIAYRHYGGPHSSRMVVNGAPGKSYRQFSAIDCVFSPDSKRLAYVAGNEARKYFVVLDGVEGIDGYTGISNLTYSPDSKRFAYTARDDDTRKYFVFLDGVRSKPYDQIVFGKNLVFSADGQRLAYTVSRGGKQFVVVDGSEGMQYDSIGDGPIFSLDGNHITYTAKLSDKWFVVTNARQGVDSKVQDCNDRFPILSPDGTRVVYQCKRGNKVCISIDGFADKAYDRITHVKFSPDSNHLAYTAWMADEMRTVIDGVEGQKYDAVGDFLFSPDSCRYAYGALGGSEQFVVVDGLEGRKYEAQGNTTKPPVFSPDSRHVSYIVESNNKAWVVVDEVEGSHYDQIWKDRLGGSDNWDKSLVFSPDGRIAYWAKQGRMWRIVVDGVESPEYWEYLQHSKLVFENANLLRGVGFRGPEILQIDIEIKAH
jgi:Tol biopolymer transport system component